MKPEKCCSSGKNLFRSFLLIVFVMSFITDVSAQQKIVNEIEMKLGLFQYEEVIRLADSLFNSNSVIDVQDKIKLKLMSGIAAFSLGDEDKAKQSFIDLLKLDSAYKPDPVKVSPKIISFFENIKNEYFSYVGYTDLNSGKSTELSLINPGILRIEKDILFNSAIRSVVFPGWGHIYAGSTTTGWILAGLNTAALSSMIYFIIDTNEKEASYLNETDKNFIQSKYDDFNKSYQTRNWLIAASALIWIYTQIDLFFFSDEMFNRKLNTELTGSLRQNSIRDLEIAIKINF